ncbi:MAG TPA: GH25 family lysozyme [Bacteroidia bacterium]|jgi:lysozyme|nr:GH25 family lysozyme [Bacteroidia bacterium]
MKKKLLLISTLSFLAFNADAQQCLSSGFCTNIPNQHQYPASTFSTTSSTWTTVSAFMNADNFTLFNVTSGDTYEWTYCEAYGGVSTGWDAQLTLTNYGTGANLCFSDNNCGTNGNAPYISWTATFTGVVQLLTSQYNCLNNSGSPYNTLVWRDASGTASTQILGIDVSHYQTITSWSQVKTDPKVFAWAKSTEGTTYTDPSYATNMTNGTAAGVVMGEYHFARPITNSATAEANYFLSVASTNIKVCNLPPVLDLEDPPSGGTLTGTFSSSALTTWVQQWMTTVQTATGIAPILYTSGSIASYLNSSLNTYKLWIADPDGSSTAQPTNIGVWTTWAFKQYSWTGTVSGISGTGNVDLDVFNGNMAAFNALIGCTTGISEKTARTDFILFPNPANDKINIENASLDNRGEMISIYNMQGQLVLQKTMQEQKTEIIISGFTPGIYIVTVKTEKGIEVKKFVKE